MMVAEEQRLIGGERVDGFLVQIAGRRGSPERSDECFERTVAFALGERLSLRTGLLLGALIHTYALNDPTVLMASGLKVDFLASLPLELRWQPRRPVSLGLRVAPTACSVAREHFINGRAAWARGAIGVQGGAYLGLQL